MLFAPFSQRRIFMDYAAGDTANPSSIHTPGVTIRRDLESARKAIAQILAVQARELVFTSGGTEANNLAILGVFRASRRMIKHPHIITSTIEHASVLEAVKQAEREGAEVSYLKVKDDGVVDISKIESLIRPETVLVSLMHANNETGTIQPVREVGLILSELKTKNYQLKTPYFHVDACQSAGYRSIEPQAFLADLLTVSGHKVHGPKGTGVLFVKQGVNVEPLLFGGGQEYSLRPGTENVEGQVRFAEAFVGAHAKRHEESRRLEELRTYFIAEITAQGSLVQYNGSRAHQLPHIVNISFLQLESDRMVLELDRKGIAVSAGSACHAGQSAFSAVIAAMRGETAAQSAIRFSFGDTATKKDIQIVTAAISDILKRTLATYGGVK